MKTQAFASINLALIVVAALFPTTAVAQMSPLRGGARNLQNYFPREDELDDKIPTLDIQDGNDDDGGKIYADRICMHDPDYVYFVYQFWSKDETGKRVADWVSFTRPPNDCTDIDPSAVGAIDSTADIRGNIHYKVPSTTPVYYRPNSGTLHYECYHRAGRCVPDMLELPSGEIVHY